MIFSYISNRKHFEPEYVLTLQELLEFLEENRLTVFLYISDNSSQMIERLKSSINAVFIERIIVITRSPITIYQVSYKFLPIMSLVNNLQIKQISGYASKIYYCIQKNYEMFIELISQFTIFFKPFLARRGHLPLPC